MQHPMPHTRYFSVGDKEKRRMHASALPALRVQGRGAGSTQSKDKQHHQRPATTREVPQLNYEPIRLQSDQPLAYVQYLGSERGH